MLRELFGYCLPVLLNTPLVDSQRLLPREDSDYPWTAQLIKLAENHYMRRMNAYWGKVVGFTDETITLQRGTRIPRTFLLAPAILSERIPLVRRAGTGHRLKDVRLGDRVYLDVEPVRDTFVGYTLAVTRRPGGKIPPADDDDLPERCRIHNIYNALQFMDEQVLPSLSRSLHYCTRWMAR